MQEVAVVTLLWTKKHGQIIIEAGHTVLQFENLKSNLKCEKLKPKAALQKLFD